MLTVRLKVLVRYENLKPNPITMKTTLITKFSGMLIILTLFILSAACDKDDDLTATINVTSVNKSSGDVNGNGGTATKTWTFTNSNSRAGWDMTINDATSGSFNLILKDDAGTVMLNKTLNAGSGAKSADGTTEEGVPGEWTVTVTLTNFNGTGDYSFL